MIGAVDDVAPYIREAQIEICPVLDGGGTRIKILESLAFAKPIVSTTIGAHGHPLGEESGILRRDDPESFARACIDLLRDPQCRRALGLLGQRAVRERFHARVTEETIRPLVETILREQGFAS
jgi:glycosyltransferase involved in cell wall biosynthesis